MEKSTGNTRTKAAGFSKCMERLEFIIVAVFTQYNIGFVKPLSLELQKSSCDFVQTKAEANRTKLSSAHKVLKLYILVDATALRALGKQPTSLQINHT